MMNLRLVMTSFDHALSNINRKIWCFGNVSLNWDLIDHRRHSRLTLWVIQSTFGSQLFMLKAFTAGEEVCVQVIVVNGQWAVLGDFNSILSADEKKGGLPHTLAKKHVSFLDIVKEAWSNEIQGKPMWILQNKLKMLSRTQHETVYSDDNRVMLHEAQANVIKRKRRQSQILRIKDSSGTWINNTDQIAQSAINYFSDMFSQSDFVGESNMRHLESKVTDLDNEALETIPTENAIRDAIFATNPNSSAGPDGCTGHFFQKTWDIINSPKLIWLSMRSPSSQ
ncbi:hypothetical protein H5410_043922, partial [Solanum commersonii]